LHLAAVAAATTVVLGTVGVHVARFDLKTKQTIKFYFLTLVPEEDPLLLSKQNLNVARFDLNTKQTIKF
jgi:hypothetical protein